MRRRRSRSSTRRFLWALVAAVVGLIQLWDFNRTKPPAPTPESGPWFVTLRDVRLLENGGNDGDSFKVAHSEGEQVLRLYFVDCPETRDYPLVHGRLKDQAGYFGGLSIPQAIQTGTEARTYTGRLLRERRFTVHTRWERVYNSERVYALVFFEDGEELSEKLVRSGLCRIHTKGTLMPDGRSEYEFENHLRAMEDEARKTRRGAWGLQQREGTAAAARR